MKKIIDILGIVLPVLILIAALVPVFSKTKKTRYNGLIILMAILLLLAGAIRYLFYTGAGSSNNEPSPTGLAVSTHSTAFNNSLEQILERYYAMSEGFVNWDTAVVVREAILVKEKLDSINLDELKKDSTGIYESALDPLSNARAELESIIKDPSIAEKRASFNILSDNLRLLLTVVQYDKAVVYWQECPMAFGDDKSGNWLSKVEAVRNPYLGTSDPNYGNKMLDCGGTKAILDFTPKKSEGK